MESHFSSPHGSSRDDGAHEYTLPAALTEGDNLVALATEAALSLALRELLGVVLVDQFLITHSATDRVSVSMSFRSPLCFSEVLPTNRVERCPSDFAEAILLLESRVGATLMDLFHTVHIDEVTLDVNAMDQLACAFTASVAMGMLGSLGN
jgi:hypothetical protein